LCNADLKVDLDNYLLAKQSTILAASGLCRPPATHNETPKKAVQIVKIYIGNLPKGGRRTKTWVVIDDPRIKNQGYMGQVRLLFRMLKC
jgi:hypothetical protein